MAQPFASTFSIRKCGTTTENVKELAFQRVETKVLKCEHGPGVRVCPCACALTEFNVA